VPSSNGSDGVMSTALVEYRVRTMRLDEGAELLAARKVGRGEAAALDVDQLVAILERPAL